jgi:biopolymer transport protein TolR
MGMSVSTGGGVKAEPNVVPMIDVMLVLLIIFMVVTPAITSGFTAQPPEGVNLKEHPEDQDLDRVLGIDKFGDFYLDKKPISLDTLGATLKRIYDARPEDKILYLKADRGIEYEKVLMAMDIAAKNGVIVLGAITDQKIGTKSSVPGDVITERVQQVPKKQ